MKKLYWIILGCCVCCLACRTESSETENWIPLFNGKNLEGWTVKITGYPCGENFANTFRVEDSVLKVSYDGYDEFNNRFGHIFTDTDYSHYKLRLEYRFTGEQASGAPGWAVRNSGAMLHCPAPETMDLYQDFPVSIEAQFLGGDGVNERTTCNVCTPGTEVVLGRNKLDGHCANSSSKTYHGDRWVAVEIVVLGDSLVHHIVEGDTVLTYSHLTLGGGGVTPDPGYREGTPLKQGRIALQSEGHPVEFRKIELLNLEAQNK